MFVTFVLRKVKYPIVALFHHFSTNVPFTYRYGLYGLLWTIHVGCLITYVLMSWSTLTFQARFLLILLFIVTGLILLLPIVLPPQSLATLVTIFLVLAFAFFFLFISTRVCYAETVLVTNRLGQFLDNTKIVETINATITDVNNNVTSALATTNTDNWLMIEGYCNSTLNVAVGPFEYLLNVVPYMSGADIKTHEKLHEMQQLLCVEQLSFLKDNMHTIGMAIVTKLGANIGVFGSGMTNVVKTSVDLLANLSDLVFEVILFVTLVYYLLEVCFIENNM